MGIVVISILETTTTNYLFKYYSLLSNNSSGPSNTICPTLTKFICMVRKDVHKCSK